MILIKILAVAAVAYAIGAIVLGPRRAWELWKSFGRRMGDLIGGVVLTVFYFTLLVPFAAVARARPGPQGSAGSPGAYWRVHPPTGAGLDAARKQSQHGPSEA
jgi:hypothetical protein